MAAENQDFAKYSSINNPSNAWYFLASRASTTVGKGEKWGREVSLQTKQD